MIPEHASAMTESLVEALGLLELWRPVRASTLCSHPLVCGITSVLLGISACFESRFLQAA